MREMPAIAGISHMDKGATWIYPRSVTDSVSNNVARFRAARNETQQELAESVGVSRQTIIAIEKGNYTPSVLLALKLAKHYDVHVDDLFDII